MVVAEAEKTEMAHSLHQEEQAKALKLAKKKHESKTAQRLAARKANPIHKKLDIKNWETASKNNNKSSSSSQNEI